MKLGVLSKAVLSQAGALLMVLLLLRAGVWGVPPSLLASVAAQAMMAALIARLLRSEGWWIFIHLIFTPAIAFALALQLPSYWYLIGFVVLALIFGPAVRHRVPLYLSNRATQIVLSEYVARYWKGRQDRFIDLGSGTGAMLVGFSKMNPHVQCEGIEGAWLTYCWSRWKALGIPNLKMTYGDFWSCDLRHYQVVYVFLSTEPMARLWQKAAQELQPGSVLISNSFEVPGVAPRDVLRVEDARQTHLYVYSV